MLTPKQLAQIGQDAGAIALTDHGTVSGSVEFYKSCKAQNVKPIMGVECYYLQNNHRHHATVLARNIDGYKGILAYQSAAVAKGGKFSILSLSDLAKIGDDIVVLTGCSTGYPMMVAQAGDEELLTETLENWYNMFPHLYTEYQPNTDYIKGYQLLLNVSSKLGIPTVVTTDIHYAKKEDHVLYQDIHRIMTKKASTMELNWLYPWTAQEMNSYFLANNFPANFVKKSVDNTYAIAEQCNVDLSFDRKWFFPADTTEVKQICKDNVTKIIQKLPADEQVKYLSRLSYELKVFIDLELIGYLMFCRDILNYCRDNSIPYGPGRGSCVGSLVCYLLGITEIDPIQHKLSFDRFLSPSHNTGLIDMRTETVHAEQHSDEEDAESWYQRV